MRCAQVQNAKVLKYKELFNCSVLARRLQCMDRTYERITAMDVLAFIASPFSASTCPPRLRAAMEARAGQAGAPTRRDEGSAGHADTATASPAITTIPGRS
jgi:hypothetical protein